LDVSNIQPVFLLFTKPMKKTSELLKIKRYSTLKKTSFILYGSERALLLYNDSLETLLKSDCIDFSVFKCSRTIPPSPAIVTDLFAIDGHSFITERTYEKLYHNLCQKVRDKRRKPLHKHMRVASGI